MKTVSTFELRNNLSNYINMVVKNDTPVVVKKFGKPIVVITPFDKRKLNDFSDYFGFMGSGEDGKEYLNRIRRSTKERNYIKSIKENA